jgi:hypothetical protein
MGSRVAFYNTLMIRSKWRPRWTWDEARKGWELRILEAPVGLTTHDTPSVFSSAMSDGSVLITSYRYMRYSSSGEEEVELFCVYSRNRASRNGFVFAKTADRVEVNGIKEGILRVDGGAVSSLVRVDSSGHMAGRATKDEGRDNRGSTNMAQRLASSMQDPGNLD